MIAYFDCFSGVSGDMVLGALVDAGVSPEKLKKELSRLPIKGYEIKTGKVKRAGFKATKVNVAVNSSQLTVNSSRKWKDIEKIIKTSSLSRDIKQKGLKIFKRLFQAEAKVHGKKYDKVHLHELGAVDCIVDIIGTLIGLDMLGINKLYSSPVNLGNGTVKTEHGILPVPAPATLELLKNVPVYASDIRFELTTPTGAAIISSLTSGFGAIPRMEITHVGIGAGNKDFKDSPNVFRLFIGHPVPSGTGQSPWPSGTGQAPQTSGTGQAPQTSGTGQGTEKGITVIETNIDDMNPQVYEYVMEKLFRAGAFDVFLTQIIMKKGRPGVKLTVLCGDDKKKNLIKIILKETTSIGLRFYEAQRKTLHREIKSVNTKLGKINVKISKLGKDILKITPEYRDCKKIAKKFDIPLFEVYKEVGSKPALRSGRVVIKKYKNT